MAGLAIGVLSRGTDVRQMCIRDRSTLAPDLATPAVEGEKPTLTIPAGTTIPLALKQAISTKNAKDGDPVYAVTAFPYVVNDRIVVPAGTYIQGKIEHVQRGGHIKGRAEVLIHFTSMIYPNGYTVMLGGSVENTPGAEKSSMKDSEGTIRQDSDTGKKAETAAATAATGAVSYTHLDVYKRQSNAKALIRRFPACCPCIFPNLARFPSRRS